MADHGWRKWTRRIALALAILLVFCVTKAWRDTMADPQLREARVILRGMPQSSASLRLLVMSDLHVAGPDMPPARIARIVAQINALQPDLVLIAGDLVSDRRLATRYYSLHDAITPLAGLTPRLGTYAVLGNHDHWRNAAEARSELIASGVTVLDNTAVRVGPLAIGGLDDDFTHHADIPAMMANIRRVGGAPVVISHSPDPFPDLPAEVPLMLAGHTHCGQISLPLIGPPAAMSRYGKRYACGRIDENGRTLFVTAGLGTSVLPFRFGVRPDIWLVTVEPNKMPR
ncbi:metallophosphoesterase [Novosphingobium sp. B 225]|uniref:metallophosphoesterase n=1 Tax=Novosphingobium sp. B 225 TaxID=1961849 RepID=UPI000B4C1C30|nr:metallophosphoesterase [Novosphingobium sp. B 225]